MGAPEATLTIHGLEGDAKRVRADVFARKLTAFIRGLIEADKLANGKQKHVYVIEELAIGSAVARVREKQKGRAVPEKSAIRTYSRAATAVYTGERYVERLPVALVSSIDSLSTGAGVQLDHAEVKFDDGVIRIDDYLKKKTQSALKLLRNPSDQSGAKHFRGTAFGSFDGELKMLDHRGELLRAALITTAGRLELDCIVNKELGDTIANSFDRRVRVDGLAHYDGESLLPTRIDVRGIAPVKQDASLRRWRGAVRKNARSADW